MSDVVIDRGSSSLGDFAAELDKAIDDAVVSGNKELPKSDDISDDIEEKDLPSDSDKDEGDVKPVDDDQQASDDEGQKSDEKSGVDDLLVERAIKAGMSIADAKTFTSNAALEKVCSILESKSGDVKESVKADDVVESTVDDFLKKFPALDPEEYDEKIVAGFDSMKDIVKHLIAANAELSKKLETSAGSDWIGAKLQALGSNYVEASLKDGKRSQLDRKFKILESGYKAAGEDVSRDAIFSEAVSLVLGSVENDGDKSAKKADELSKRESQFIGRASGANRKPKASAEEQVIEELNRRFFKS